MKFPGWLFALIIFVADQATKLVALAYLSDGDVIEVAPFFNLLLVWNTGVSFGMFRGQSELGRWLLIGLAVVISVGLLFWLAREKRFSTRLAIWAILAGAVGNVIDRLRFGAVVDFLDFHLSGYHWPAFNVADSAIVLGALTILVQGLRAEDEPVHQAGKDG